MVVPDCISIRGDRIILRPNFEDFTIKKNKTDLQIQNEGNLKLNYPSGHMNRKIRLRINKILHNWYEALTIGTTTNSNIVKRQFTFITLTLPSEQMHTDKDLHRKALNNFIIIIKRKFNVVNYLWRAEKQKNGNLHYHILADAYIHYLKVRDTWNKILEPLGYIDIFEKNNGHRNPNSTDIHSLKKAKNAVKYISKYTSKSDTLDNYHKLQAQYSQGLIATEDFNLQAAEYLQKLDNEKINARVWGCSDNIKNLKDFKINECAIVNHFIEEIEKNENTKIIEKDNCKILYNSATMQVLSNHKQLYKYYNLFHKRIFLWLYYPERLFRRAASPPSDTHRSGSSASLPPPRYTPLLQGSFTFS